MNINSNFNLIHLEEQRIRKRSIARIEKNSDLSKHFSLIHDSMDLISFITRNHTEHTDDELTVMRLAIRNFNSAGASIKLGLSGYYHSAISQIREIFETVMLLDYFSSNPEKVDEWATCERSHRLKQFKPVLIRKNLDERDSFSEKKRDKDYRLLSELASHPTMDGFKLYSPDGMTKRGPFYNFKLLVAWMQELSKIVPYGSAVLINLIESKNINIIDNMQSFIDRYKKWNTEFITTKSN